MATNLQALPASYRFGVFDVEPATGEIRKRGTRVRIQEKPFQVLVALLEHPGEVVTREQLCERLWPAGIHVEFDESLNAAVKRLRRVLGDAPDPPRFIETIPRRGYRLLASVERVDRAEPATAPEPTPPTRRSVWPSWLRRAGLAGGACLALVLLGVLVYRASAPVPVRASAAVENRRITLAILPFQNFSGDVAQDYLGDGLTEELITQLGGLLPSRLRVIARTSAMRYRGSPRDIQEIAAELGADYVLEGSVRPANGRVRVVARLVEVSGRTQVWGETYDRALVDVLEAQLDVARSVSQALAADLFPDEPTALARAGTTSGEAYDFYLRGLRELRSGTAGGFSRARDLFESAVKTDASYALAQWGLAEVWLREAQFKLRAPEDSYRKTVEAANRASALDPRLPQAYATLAEAEHKLGNRGAAARAFARGIEVGPLPPEGRIQYAWFLHDEGRDPEALAEVARAQELDPASPEASTARAYLLLLAGNIDDAARQALEAVTRYPDYPYAHYTHGEILKAQGQHDKALAAFEQAHAVGDGAPKYALRLGIAYVDAGRTNDARRMLEKARTAARVRYVKPQDLESLRARLNSAARVAGR